MERRISTRMIVNLVMLVLLFSGKLAMPLLIGFIALFWYLRVRRRRVANR